MRNKLAIKGGTPVRTTLFPSYNTIGQEEKDSVMKILDTGNLSQFLGAWHKDFYGGPTIQAFEKAWAEVFGVKYAISVNSNTSGLFAAMGACNIQPGDEVIVSSYTMSASALAPMIYGGVPVFADIDTDNFCLSPESIESKITSRTKAILIVHIFGNSAKMDQIMAIAKKYNLRVIEDTAQAPLGEYKGKFVGTIGDIGVFSLNYHKHIHTGEGGVIVTNDDTLAEKLYLIRNHGENIVDPKGVSDLTNSWGYNYRMTEIEAAIGIEQLKKLPGLIEERIKNADFLKQKIGEIKGLIPPFKEDGVKHVYYVQAFKYKADFFDGIPRNVFIDAVKAEIPSAILREDTPLLASGYVRPLYLLPLYQKRISNCSYNCPRYEGEVSYEKGLCPNAEHMHYNELFFHEYMRPGMSQQDLNDVVDAFYKVAENYKELL